MYSWEFGAIDPAFHSRHTSIQHMLGTLIDSLVIDIKSFVIKAVESDIASQVQDGTDPAFIQTRRDGLASFNGLLDPFDFPANQGSLIYMLHRDVGAPDRSIPWATHNRPGARALDGELHTIGHLDVARAIVRIARDRRSHGPPIPLKSSVGPMFKWFWDILSRDVSGVDSDQITMTQQQYVERIALALVDAKVRCLPWGRDLDARGQVMDPFLWVRITLDPADKARIAHQVTNAPRSTRQDIAFRNRQGLANDIHAEWSIIEVPFRDLKSILPRARAPDEWDMFKLCSPTTELRLGVRQICDWAFATFKNTAFSDPYFRDAVLVARALWVLFPHLALSEPVKRIQHVSRTGEKSYSHVDAPIPIFTMPWQATSYLRDFAYTGDINRKTKENHHSVWWTKATLIIVAFTHPESPLRKRHADLRSFPDFANWAGMFMLLLASILPPFIHPCPP